MNPYKYRTGEGGGRREKDLDDEVFGINYAILCFYFLGAGAILGKHVNRVV